MRTQGLVIAVGGADAAAHVRDALESTSVVAGEKGLGTVGTPEVYCTQ